LHQPHGQVGYGQVTDLEIAAKEILRMRDLLEELLSKHTGQPLERVHSDTDRDFVMVHADLRGHDSRDRRKDDDADQGGKRHGKGHGKN